MLLALGTAFTLTPMSGAQEPVKPEFSFGPGTTFKPRAWFTVYIKEATCPGGPVSLTSPGFALVNLDALHDSVVTTPGRCTATLKCKDTTEAGTLDFTVEQPSPPRSDPFLDKAEYAPGETIKINLHDGRSCFGKATSEGFTAPAELTPLATITHLIWVGEAEAITTPGTCQASILCIGTQVINQFTIKAAPTPPPGNPAPKPKPPIVKPKGAPDTGAGGTA